MIPFNYHHLYYFYVVAGEGSVLKASRKLNLSPSAISMQLKQFESFWNRPLFTRSKQGLTLTEDGKSLLDYAETIFELGRDLRDHMEDRPIGGRLSIDIGVEGGTPRSFSHALVLQVLTHERTAHVAIHEGSFEDLVGELNQQQIDLILSNHPMQSLVEGEFTNRLVGKVPIVFAAAPQLAKRFAKLPGDLNGAPFIMPLAPSQLYQQIQDFFSMHHITPQIIAEVQDVEVARRLAISGIGIAPLNAYTVMTNESMKSLSVLGRKRLPSMYETLYLISRKRRRANPLAKFLVENFSISDDIWKSLRLRRL